MTEVKRERNISIGSSDRVGYSYNTYCVVCARRISLKYNGGELDTDYCCGHSYRLEIQQIDFIVEKE